MNNTPMTYNLRITIACPSAHTDTANQLALCLGESPADVNTFGEPGWQDAQGNKYSVCSFVCTEQWLTTATATLPERNGADLEQARQALDAIVLYQHGYEQAPATQATPQQIALAVDVEPLTALSAMGLTRIEHEEI